MAGASNRGPSGWASFAGVILFIVGTFDVLYGLAAVLNDNVVTVGGGGGVIVWDFTTWGWIHIVLGGLMVATSIGLFAVRSWARFAAIVFATLSAIAQIGLITAFPLWSILIIALDVLVIYHLTVQGGEQAA